MSNTEPSLDSLKKAVENELLHDDAEKLTLGQKIADMITDNIGSWKFILIQTGIVLVWMIANLSALIYQWDPYPFTFLNLVFSTQAAYAAPIIMMSQNRQSEKDRKIARYDLQSELRSTEELQKVQERILQMEKRFLAQLEEQEELLKNQRFAQGLDAKNNEEKTGVIQPAEVRA